MTSNEEIPMIEVKYFISQLDKNQKKRFEIIIKKIEQFAREDERNKKEKSELFDRGYEQGCADTKEKIKESLKFLKFNGTESYKIAYVNVIKKIENLLKELEGET